MITSMVFQYKQAWLSLKSKPGFIAAVVSTMGTTLGALICVLTLAYLLLFQPLPYPEQERLHQVNYSYLDGAGATQFNSFNFASLMEVYKDQDIFEQSSMVYFASNVVTSLPHQPTLPISFINYELMDMLDIPMAMGRRFDDREALNTHHPVVILSYNTWQKDYNADPDILSKKVGLKGRQYNIIGVTAKNFIEPKIFRQGINTDLWFPWDFQLSPHFIDTWNPHNKIGMIAKLKPNQTAFEIEQTYLPIINDFWRDNNTNLPDFAKDWTVKLTLKPLATVLLGESKNSLYLLLAGVLGLVLIASANITNLFVSRTAEQQKKLAIQAALGAKKSQLIRLILAESSLLMALSIVVALIVASAGFYLIKTYLASILPRVDELQVNVITFTCALLLAALAAIYFALISSKMINYRALSTQLQSSGKGTGVQVSKRIRQVLISSQVAIAMVLVFANMSLFNTAINNINASMGFNVDNMLHASFSVSAQKYPEGDVVQPIMLDLQKQLTQLPQVESAEISHSPLLEFYSNPIINPYTNKMTRVGMKQIGKHYFSMIEQPLLAGNFFTDNDINNPTDNAVSIIVNDIFAKELGPLEDIIGKPVTNDGFTVKIIGVVKDIQLPGDKTIINRAYSPSSSNMTKMNIKLLPNQTLTRTEVVTAIKSVTSLYALYGLESLSDTRDTLLFSEYATAVTTAALAIITLFLAAIGLYGILSYGTQMRRFEIGTRMAIGAKAKDIIELIIKENSIVILIGVVLSIFSLLAIYVCFTTQITAYLSYNLLTIYALTLAVIIMLCLLACYWPLRQYIKQPAIYSLQGSH